MMSLLVSIGTWIKTHLLVSIIIGTVVVGGAIATPIIINNLNSNDEIKENDKTNEDEIEQKEKEEIVYTGEQECLEVFLHYTVPNPKQGQIKYRWYCLMPEKSSILEIMELPDNTFVYDYQNTVSLSTAIEREQSTSDDLPKVVEAFEEAMPIVRNLIDNGYGNSRSLLEDYLVPKYGEKKANEYCSTGMTSYLYVICTLPYYKDMNTIMTVTESYSKMVEEYNMAKENWESLNKNYLKWLYSLKEKYIDNN